jgi:PTH1 family peptidyl-tRNA hydrolase
MAFRRKPVAPPAPVTAMVVGLGNPGPEYRGTRHNVGFLALDTLARRLGIPVVTRDKRAQVGLGTLPGGKGNVLLVKPQTYMNLSGTSVAPLLRKHHLTTENLWVLHDEIDIPFGRVRIRRGGGAGGHNGVSSIIQSLGGDGDFIRVRMGVGRPEGEDTIDHVLGGFPDGERERVPALVDLAVDAATMGLSEGLEKAMNQFNGQAV